MRDKLKARGMCAVEVFMLVEILQLVYLLFYIINCICDPAAAADWAVKLAQVPSIFEHVMMGTALASAGAFLFDAFL